MGSQLHLDFMIFANVLGSFDLGSEDKLGLYVDTMDSKSTEQSALCITNSL